MDYAALDALNPKLIYVLITPFGQDGPKASYADSDLIVMAAGGPQVLTGDDDRPPVRLSVPQGYLHASGDAAVGALLAIMSGCARAAGSTSISPRKYRPRWRRNR